MQGDLIGRIAPCRVAPLFMARLESSDIVVHLQSKKTTNPFLKRCIKFIALAVLNRANSAAHFQHNVRPRAPRPAGILRTNA